MSMFLLEDECKAKIKQKPKLESLKDEQCQKEHSEGLAGELTGKSSLVPEGKERCSWEPSGLQAGTHTTCFFFCLVI